MSTTSLSCENKRQINAVRATSPREDEFAIEVFFDGACPLCRREIDIVRKLDRCHRIRLTDIAAAQFRPSEYGKSLGEFMSEIQGRLPSGQWIQGVEVFRQLYSAIGLGWLASISRFPIITQLTEFAYRVFARNRLRWTGRCDDRCDIEPQGAASGATDA
jgi:predicted DCC family thiol-disulfide oxidoreductase YuxK